MALLFILCKYCFDYFLRNAIDDLMNELGTASAMLKTDPFAVLNLLGVPDGVLSTSTQGQLGQKLAIAASAVGKTAMRMLNMTQDELDKAMPELGTRWKGRGEEGMSKAVSFHPFPVVLILRITIYNYLVMFYR